MNRKKILPISMLASVALWILGLCFIIMLNIVNTIAMVALLITTLLIGVSFITYFTRRIYEMKPENLSFNKLTWISFGLLTIAQMAIGVTFLGFTNIGSIKLIVIISFMGVIVQVLALLVYWGLTIMQR